MSTKIIDANKNRTSQIVYDRAAAQAAAEPAFKPGNTPYTQFGDETLNANIRWHEIVQDILVHYTQEQLSAETGIIAAHHIEILRQNYCHLNFKKGAQLLAIHSRFCPEHY